MFIIHIYIYIHPFIPGNIKTCHVPLPFFKGTPVFSVKESRPVGHATDPDHLNWAEGLERVHRRRLGAKWCDSGLNFQTQTLQVPSIYLIYFNLYIYYIRIPINLRVKYSAMTDTAQMGLSKYDTVFLRTKSCWRLHSGTVEFRKQTVGYKNRSLEKQYTPQMIFADQPVNLGALDFQTDPNKHEIQVL